MKIKKNLHSKTDEPESGLNRDGPIFRVFFGWGPGFFPPFSRLFCVLFVPFFGGFLRFAPASMTNLGSAVKI